MKYNFYEKENKAYISEEEIKEIDDNEIKESREIDVLNKLPDQQNRRKKFQKLGAIKKLHNIITFKTIAISTKALALYYYIGLVDRREAKNKYRT